MLNRIILAYVSKQLNWKVAGFYYLLLVSGTNMSVF